VRGVIKLEKSAESRQPEARKRTRAAEMQAAGRILRPGQLKKYMQRQVRRTEPALRLPKGVSDSHELTRSRKA
jgi:hypothetical protein